MKSLFIVLTASIALAGCQLGEVDPSGVDLGKEYFPVDSGQYREYLVKERLYQTLGSVGSSYYLREVMMGSTEVFDEETHYVYRYIRDDTLSSWDLDSIWTMVVTEKQGISVENNQRFIKLVFPTTEGTMWDANVANSREEDYLSLVEVGEPYTLDEFSFDETVTTEREYVTNLITVDTRTEVYAKDVGLIYSIEQVTNQQPGDSLFGFWREQTLIDYGP